MKILNFGSCNIDFVYGVESIVKPGETIRAGAMHQYPGGKGLNQSIALARAQTEVWHAGCVGSDDTILRRTLEENGVHTEYLRTLPAQTGHAIIQVEARGENSIVIYSGTNGMIDEAYIDEVLAQFDAGDFLILQNEINNLEYIIQKAGERGLKIVLNPSPFHPSLAKLDLTHVACLILNEVEAAGFSSIAAPYDSICWMAEQYPQLLVVLTLGKRGCFYLEQGEVKYHPSFQVKAVDTTAAGDTFTGYFVAELCRNQPLETCIRRASAAAGISTTREGAAPSIPCLEEVEKQSAELEILTDSPLDWQKNLIDGYLKHHTKDASLEEAARLLHYSPAYTSRWIKEHMGRTFSSLLQRERCRQAAELLTTTELPIHAIIERVGYSNESFFRKVFYEEYQVLPHAYKRKKGRIEQ